MQQKAFTIVELMAVIVVIGILASIVIAFYPGHELRIRNDQRKSDLSQLSSALKAYALQKNNYIGTDSGCGSQGDGSGWLSATSSENGSYQRSITDCLHDAGVLSDDFIDPSKCVINTTDTKCAKPHVQAYMKATCTKNGDERVILLAYLEGEPSKTSEIAGLCDANTVPGFTTTPGDWASEYGMNYYEIVK